LSFVAQFQAWLKQPFTPTMSAAQWAAFMGLILIAVIFWRMVISALTEAARADL
jgi:hypothetical protein